MKQHLIKTFTIVISITVFIYSFSFNVFSYKYQKVETISSFETFLMGRIAILGGGFYEWIIWLANPLFAIAAVCLIFDKYIAIKFALSSLLLSLLFLSSNTILAAESGTRGEILAIKPGYYLWLTSTSMFTIGTLFYFKNYRKVKYDD